MSRCEDHVDGTGAEFKPAIGGDRFVGQLEACTGEKHICFVKTPANWIGDRVIELLDLRLELAFGADYAEVGGNRYAPLREEVVAADVVEVTFCIDHAHAVGGPDRVCIAVNRGGGQGIASCVNYECPLLSGNETRVDRPGAGVAEASYRIAEVSDAHG